MSEPIVTVVVPTLAAGSALLDCVFSLERQVFRDFEVIIVDNSGKQLVRESVASRFRVKVIESERNVGYGGAINLAAQQSDTPFIAALNDDAIAHPKWLSSLMEVMEARPEVGMCASRVVLAGINAIDSVGMLIGGDGTSKQRGHLEPPEAYTEPSDALLPSGSAALYRRAMLDDVGFFDEDFFLYCEDTDLGLRARWAGWDCAYVPGAMVDHYYSQTVGGASPLKAYYVERNRMFVAVKNLPFGMLVRAPWYTLARYGWHLISMFQKNSLTGRIREKGHGPVYLAFIVLRAHCSMVCHLPRLLAKRRKIRQRARIDARRFRALIEKHWITPRQVGTL